MKQIWVYMGYSHSHTLLEHIKRVLFERRYEKRESAITESTYVNLPENPIKKFFGSKDG